MLSAMAGWRPAGGWTAVKRHPTQTVSGFVYLVSRRTWPAPPFLPSGHEETNSLSTQNQFDPCLSSRTA